MYGMGVQVCEQAYLLGKVRYFLAWGLDAGEEGGGEVEG